MVSTKTIGTITVDMVSRIKQLLDQGKTTREIARELRVSLRDIHRVRRQTGIDIGALERQRNVLNNEIANKGLELHGLQQQIQRLNEEKQGLEAEIKRKQTQVQKVVTPIKPIYLPQNFLEVGEYLKSLSGTQLEWLYNEAFRVHLSLMQDEYRRRWKNLLQNST